MIDIKYNIICITYDAHMYTIYVCTHKYAHTHTYIDNGIHKHMIYRHV